MSGLLISSGTTNTNCDPNTLTTKNPYPVQAALSGTITPVAGSNLITGSGTSFQTQFIPQNAILSNGGQKKRIYSVDSNTQMHMYPGDCWDSSESAAAPSNGGLVGLRNPSYAWQAQQIANGGTFSPGLRPSGTLYPAAGEIPLRYYIEGLGGTVTGTYVMQVWRWDSSKLLWFSIQTDTVTTASNSFGSTGFIINNPGNAPLWIQAETIPSFNIRILFDSGCADLF